MKYIMPYHRNLCAAQSVAIYFRNDDIVPSLRPCEAYVSLLSTKWIQKLRVQIYHFPPCIECVNKNKLAGQYMQIAHKTSKFMQLKFQICIHPLSDAAASDVGAKARRRQLERQRTFPRNVKSFCKV